MDGLRANEDDLPGWGGRLRSEVCDFPEGISIFAEAAEVDAYHAGGISLSDKSAIEDELSSAACGHACS